MEDSQTEGRVLVGDLTAAGSNMTEFLCQCLDSELHGDITVVSSDGQAFLPHRLVLAVSPFMANILPPKPIDSRRESVDCVTECSKNKRNSAKTANHALRLLQMGTLLLVMCR